MLHIARWKFILILVVCAFGIIYSAPNLLSAQTRQYIEEKLPGIVPHQSVNLGLDLQGGSHLLLQVELDSVIKERAEGVTAGLRPEMRKEKIGYRRLKDTPNGVLVQLRDSKDVDTLRDIIRDLDRNLEIDVKGDTVEATFSEMAIKEIQDQTINQSIEIVRRRIDETGTREPVIQRQGDDRILVQLPGLDDPQRVKDLLGKTAKLGFHLVDASGSRTASSSMTLPMADMPGESITVDRRAELTGDMLVNASFTPDQNGQPAVSFRFNTIGAKRFCDLSRENVNKLFAIVLDNEVISAPVIREPICGGQGQISGNFSVKEANDLALLLRAGALPAPLSILEERTVGPSLGADSIAAGKIASMIAMIGVLFFMLITYGRFGIYANVALMVNVTLIFALLSSMQATLTLPGIAGIVLTIGMAVDANVLIFERIKEEIANGRSPMSAIDAGFSRAMSTIIDSNLTTLIAAIILYSFGTGPIKGFAVTLAIGIITSFFSAIMVTRLMVVTWLLKNKPTELKI